MDDSSELETSGLVCPMKKCQKQCGNAKKLLKHFRKFHPTKWILMCSHCSSYVTTKIHRVDRHFKKNHSEECLRVVCVCHSSHKIDKAMFKDYSFPVKYSCLHCSFNTEDVKTFNTHTESHFEDHEIKSESEDASTVNSDMEASLVNGSGESLKSLNRSETSHSDPYFNYLYNENSLMASSRAIFPCPVCGKCFTRERSIKSHMVVHTDERAFHCSLCNYKARRMGDLSLHIDKTHQHQRPYSCNVCSKTFGFRSNLNKHMITHDDIKPFKCDKCNARFKFKCSVTKHLKKGCHYRKKKH